MKQLLDDKIRVIKLNCRLYGKTIPKEIEVTKQEIKELNDYVGFDLAKDGGKVFGVKLKLVL